MTIKRFDRNGTPIISDKQIDEFAHEVLADYKSGLLKEPTAIRFEHFLESYLGFTLDFKDIFNEDPARPIFAATAFNDGVLKIFDRENTCVRQINVLAKTVVIDNYVMQSGKEGLALFTGMHEGGHILIHPRVYNPECEGQTSLFPSEILAVICYRSENIENFGQPYRKKRTKSEWLEHHADCFAAATTMPNATFKPFIKGLLRDYGVRRDKIYLGQNADIDRLANQILPFHIHETYGVSKKAAQIKLIKCGFVVDERDMEVLQAAL